MTAMSIERKIALATGKIRYFTGKPCIHGHIAERHTSDKGCVECGKVKAKRLYSRNPEKFKARQKELRSENYETIRAREKKNYAENKEKYRAQLKKSRDKNPERTKALRRLHENRRRAKKLDAGGSYTNEQILDLFKKQKGKCVNCLCSIKRGWHNDHIIALAKGGSNYISNIQLLCQSCNNRKHAKDPIVWAQENGRLL